MEAYQPNALDMTAASASLRRARYPRYAFCTCTAAAFCTSVGSTSAVMAALFLLRGSIAPVATSPELPYANTRSQNSGKLRSLTPRREFSFETPVTETKRRRPNL